MKRSAVGSPKDRMDGVREYRGLSRAVSMLPKEHGAYGQIAFPILTAFFVSGISVAGLLIAAPVVAGFLAHEPAAVLLGLRGTRARRDLRPPAVRWLGCAVAVGVIAGALLTLNPAVRWSLAVPLAPALLLAVATATGNDKSWQGETSAAVAFAETAVPVSMAASAPAEGGLAVAIPFALLFVASTLAVRVVILGVRGGGDIQATTATRRATLSLVAGAAAVLALVVAIGLLPASVLITSIPGLLTAALIAVRPPKPNRLRTVGWTLIGVSVVTTAIIVATA
jgi:YwiC-like protein